MLQATLNCDVEIVEITILPNESGQGGASVRARLRIVPRAPTLIEGHTLTFTCGAPHELVETALKMLVPSVRVALTQAQAEKETPDADSECDPR